MFSKNKKNGVPDRWLDYRAVGERIPRTRFIAFKVPLRPGLTRMLPPDEAFGPWELLDALQESGQELGLIIDLTFTTRYYKLHDLPQSLHFIKIFTEGHQVPSDQTILSFKRAVRHFLRENPDNDKLIGVHCTHGLNRTGYLVCRYLIDVDGFDPGEAVQLFNSSRGHPIERQNYLGDLQSGPRRSNEGMDQSEQDPMRGLAVARPEFLPIGQDGPLTRPHSVAIGQEDRRHQWSGTDGQYEAVRPRRRRPFKAGGGEGVNHHQSPPRGGGTNWSPRRDLHHQSWRGETNRSPSRAGSSQSHPRGGFHQSPSRRGGSNQSHPRGGFHQSPSRRGGSNQSHPRGGFHQSPSRGGSNQSYPREGFNQSHTRGGFNQTPPRAGTNQSHPWSPRGGQGFPPAAAPPLAGFPPRGDGLLPLPPPPGQWIHPARAAAGLGPGGPPFGAKRPSSSSQSEWGSPRSHASKRRERSRDHHRAPPHPSQLPRYAPAFPPDHE